MKIIDKALMAEFAAQRRCEYCKRALRHPAHPHHLRTRGFGGGDRLDIRINLIALGGAWDCNCHGSHHDGNAPLTIDLLAVVAARENTTQDAITAEIVRLRRAPKGTPYP